MSLKIINRELAKKIKALYKAGHGLREIGAIHHISNPTVLRALDIYYPNFKRRPVGAVCKPRKEIKCAFCGRKKLIKPWREAQFCSHLCFLESKRTAPKHIKYFTEESREYRRKDDIERGKAYYHNVYKKDPKKMAAIRKRSREYSRKKKLNNTKNTLTTGYFLLA